MESSSQAYFIIFILIVVNTRTDEMKALQLILIEQAKSNTAEAKTEEVKIKKLKGVVRIHCTDSSAA